jgi:hypothetical protein
MRPASMRRQKLPESPQIALSFTAKQGSVCLTVPEPSFLYLLHAIMDEVRSATKVVESADWRLFLMSRGDVEAELLRLHQFRKLHYESAGSLVQLQLPCASAAEYARGWWHERLA